MVRVSHAARQQEVKREPVLFEIFFGTKRIAFLLAACLHPTDVGCCCRPLWKDEGEEGEYKDIPLRLPSVAEYFHCAVYLLLSRILQLPAHKQDFERAVEKELSTFSRRRMTNVKGPACERKL